MRTLSERVLSLELHFIKKIQECYHVDSVLYLCRHCYFQCARLCHLSPALFPPCTLVSSRWYRQSLVLWRLSFRQCRGIFPKKLASPTLPLPSLSIRLRHIIVITRVTLYRLSSYCSSRACAIADKSGDANKLSLSRVRTIRSSLTLRPETGRMRSSPRKIRASQNGTRLPHCSKTSCLSCPTCWPE